MAISEDTGTQPAPVQDSGASPATTASFSPKAGTLLVAMSAVNAPDSAANTITISDSLSGSWTLLKRQNTNVVGSLGGSAEIWCRYLTTAPGSMTVTSTWTGGDNGGNLVVRCLFGALPTQNGATGGSGGASIAPTASLSPSVMGSRVYGSLLDFSAATVMVPNSQTTIIDQFNDVTNGDTYAALKSTFVTSSLNSTTYGCTNVNAAFNIAIAEILPIQLDGSAIGHLRHPGRGPAPKQRIRYFTSPRSFTTGDLVATAETAQGLGLAYGMGSRSALLLALTQTDVPLSIGALPDTASGTGSAFDAVVTTSSGGTTANADVALGTGTAFGPVVDIGSLPDAATGTGTALTVDHIDISSFPDTSTGTGTAQQPVTDVGALPGTASGSGSAFTIDHTDISVLGTETASGSGSAQSPVTDVGALPDTASGSGTALTVDYIDIGAAPSTASGTGAALANDHIDIVVQGTGTATAAGTALDTVSDVGVLPGTATGSGTAQQPVTDVGPLPDTASGTGSSLQPVSDVTALPDTAVGPGAAYDATVSTSGSTIANAGSALGTGSAFDTVPDVGSLPGTATATGSALTAVPDIGGLPGTATGSGLAQDPSTAVAVQGTGTATGSGTAGGPLSDTAVLPGPASGSGSAFDASVSVTVVPGVALGTGLANGASVVLPQSGTPTTVSGREPGNHLYGRESPAGFRGQDSGLIYGREQISSTSGREPDTSLRGREP